MEVKDITYLYPKFLDIAKYHGASPDDSQDIVQDLFEKLLIMQEKEGSINRITYKGQINMVYLFNAIKNRVINNRRYHKKFIDTDFIPERTGNETSFISIEINNRLHRLGPYYHKLYSAYIEDDISMRELAKKTDISLTTIFHSVQHIKVNLKPLFYDNNNKPDDHRPKEKMVRSKIKVR